MRISYQVTSVTFVFFLSYYFFAGIPGTFLIAMLRRWNGFRRDSRCCTLLCEKPWRATPAKRTASRNLLRFRPLLSSPNGFGCCPAWCRIIFKMPSCIPDIWDLQVLPRDKRGALGDQSRYPYLESFENLNVRIGYRVVQHAGLIIVLFFIWRLPCPNRSERCLIGARTASCPG